MQVFLTWLKQKIEGSHILVKDGQGNAMVRILDKQQLSVLLRELGPMFTCVVLHVMVLQAVL